MFLLAEGTNTLIGGLYLVILFIFCFSAAYAYKAVVLMINKIKHLSQLPTISTPRQQKAPPEKIYYIVERKKAPVKRRVTTPPKQIFFNDSSR